MRWKIVHSVCANVVGRSTCRVGFDGGTEISTIKVNISLCTDFRRHNVCHAPRWRARSLIQFASYPRSASNIVFGSTALRRTEHSRLSCASPGVGCSAVQPCAQPRPPGTEFLDAEKRQKSSFKRANARRDQNPGTEWPEIPTETRYSASCRKRAVCGDWRTRARTRDPLIKSHR